ncbi:MAG TPA: GGDEF domain-containing protein [Patescibacteria group bacterium]|nr:GGDEF domain-containing protein [Patescibacteria group bacterium]
MALQDQTLAADLKVLAKYYDIARIVDLPVTVSDTGCFTDEKGHFGELGERCPQCICRQALHCKETVMKMVTLGDSKYMITAMPLAVKGNTVVLELIKQVAECTWSQSLALSGENVFTQDCSIAKMTDLAFHDALTNLYNRRYIDKQLLAEIYRSRQLQQPFSVIMTDIDNFKQINDQYGHSVGDEVLKDFAAKIQSNIRQNSSDWSARYGGEEFLIVLENCPADLAFKISEKLRTLIEKTIFFTTAGDLRLTASFGIYTSYGQETKLEQLIDRVDAYLYRAKRAGRNRTVTSRTESFYPLVNEEPAVFTTGRD